MFNRKIGGKKDFIYTKKYETVDGYKLLEITEIPLANTVEIEYDGEFNYSNSVWSGAFFFGDCIDGDRHTSYAHKYKYGEYASNIFLNFGSPNDGYLYVDAQLRPYCTYATYPPYDDKFLTTRIKLIPWEQGTRKIIKIKLENKHIFTVSDHLGNKKTFDLGEQFNIPFTQIDGAGVSSEYLYFEATGGRYKYSDNKNIAEYAANMSCYNCKIKLDGILKYNLVPFQSSILPGRYWKNKVDNSAIPDYDPNGRMLLASNGT